MRAIRLRAITRTAVALFAGLMLSTGIAVTENATPAHAKVGAMSHPTSGTVIRKINRNCDGSANNHRGIDIANSSYAWVYAAYRGKVVNINRNAQGGVNITIRHINGYTTRYHRLRLDYLKVIEGQSVDRGRVLGAMGFRGHNDGRHFLHFEVRQHGEAHTALNQGFRCGARVTAREPINAEFPGLW